MARFLNTSKRANPSNPSIFGEDVMSLAIEGIGLAGTAMVSDKYINPLVGGVIPGGGAGSKLVEAGSTAVTAWLVGKVVGMLDRRWGRLMERGGLVLAGARVVSMVIPNYGITATFPGLGNILPAPETAAALNGGTSSTDVAGTRTAINAMGL